MGKKEKPNDLDGNDKKILKNKVSLKMLSLQRSLIN